MPDYLLIALVLAIIAAILGYFVSWGLAIIVGFVALVVVVIGLAGHFRA